jgi:thiol-disulfide isomerase/thioredoxin
MGKILGIMIGIALLALAGVGGYAYWLHVRAPLNGSVAEFKLETPTGPVPAGAFVDADGKPLDLTKFRGKYTLVNFWATWCQPCVAEIPSLERLKRARDGDRFQVEAISEDRGGKIAIVDFFKRASVTTLPQYSDTETVYSRLLNFQSLPTTILLDPEGRELGRYDAGQVDWDGADAWHLIQWIMDKNDKQKTG